MMNLVLRILLLSLGLAHLNHALAAEPSARADVVAKSAAGKFVPAKPVPDAENSCIECHATLTAKDQTRFLVKVEEFANDAHWQKGVRCQDCHGGDPTVREIKSHQGGDDFRVVKSPGDHLKLCGACHQQQLQDLLRGGHKPGTKNAQGQAAPSACTDCHADRPQRTSHGLLPSRDIRSSMFLTSQVRACGKCHPADLATYNQSVHAHGLRKSGLLVTAVCADCHGGHAVYSASKRQSPLHYERVEGTCGKCHRLIAERLEASVHARGAHPAEKTGPAPVARRRKPSCTDCHEGHALPRADTLRLASADRCGKCHADFVAGYALSAHGSLTTLGYGPAAKCADCHGAHDILPVSNPDSKLSSQNRGETCRKCHADAPANFMDFDPHADHRDSDRDPILHGVYLVLLTLLFTTFGVFGLHSLLWFVRGMIDVMVHGRPPRLVPGTVAYLRFGPFHRVAHTVMVLSFLGLAATGLPLKYSYQGWAQVLANVFGGFESTSVAHRAFGVINTSCLVVYMVKLGWIFWGGPRNGGSRLGMIFGPDSPVPNFRDVKDAVSMVRWFLGLGPRPTFERWAYWEKFDFWGACADIVIIGGTGLVLWFPNFFCAFLPGKALNIAKVIHSTQALLATGFVFAIHFFNTHLRPDKFPMDLSMLTGRVSAEELHEERGDYLERMRREGKLEGLKALVPWRDVMSMILLGGAVGLFAGLSLLVGILVGALGG
jgi:cytochrome b subunit of formate dehydrogenase